MIDLSNLGQYRENNRLEAKKALGGLPHSIWETYSAFANTLGGLLLLGVEEYRDKTLHTVDLPDPEGLAEEFWGMVNDPKTASVNILSRSNISIETVNDDRIIVIDIPRAHRYLKPVYVGGDAVHGIYRRTGEGDFHCTDEELRAMYRDASVRTQDMLLLKTLSMGRLSRRSVDAYALAAGHAAGDTSFLRALGASDLGPDGEEHPTAAGLLMFGREEDIRSVYPFFRLDYRDLDTGSRLLSSSGDRSGNVWDFFTGVSAALTAQTGTAEYAEETARALREALVNCLINADYYSRRGVYIIKKRDLIIMTNPGDFRIEVSSAVSGGRSDPRNGVLMKLFNHIRAVESTGSGIPGIFGVWRKLGRSEPGIVQNTEAGTVTLYLPLDGAAFASKNSGKNEAMRTVCSQLLVDYLTDHASASLPELAFYIGVRPGTAEAFLTPLISKGIITEKDGEYRLRA